jgi:two-component system NarL family sensor kinase
MATPEPAARPAVASLIDLARSPELRGLLLDHAYRGFRVQLIVRVVLAVFIVLTVVSLPPANDQLACVAIATAYAIWALAIFVGVRKAQGRVLRLSWLSPYGDLIAVALVTVIASVSDQRSWTADVLVNGMFLIPVLASLQLRVWAAVWVTVPTALVFIGCCIAARQANSEPWASVSLRSLALIGVCLGATLIVRVQSSRVIALGHAAEHRAQLLRDLVDTERRERRQLSERLHDGALQYVMSARQDLDDLAPGTDQQLRARLETALREASALLRSQLAELNPAVLQQAGLVVALRRLAEDAGNRGHFTVTVTTSDWDPLGQPGPRRSEVDQEIFDSAREFLSNVVKHANARSVAVTLTTVDGSAQLTVADDGDGGINSDVLRERLSDGHIGLASRRVRVESVGGRLVIESGLGGRGTGMTVIIPFGDR